LLREYGSSLSASEHTALLEQLPLKWERLGELVLLPIGTCAGPEWEVVPQAELWRAIAEALQTSKLARQAPVASTGTR
jgi:tRNA wybutosine-synthesizing protein 3